MIGLDLGGGVITAQRVAQVLAGRRLVLVLDTCEHVISAAATLAEALLRAGGTLHLLATSREPLRAEGEWVYPVPPLAVPAEDVEDADDLLRYGGVRLSVERLRAAEPHFAPDRRSAAMIAAICRRLDGIPLAIGRGLLTGVVTRTGMQGAVGAQTWRSPMFIIGELRTVRPPASAKMSRN